MCKIISWEVLTRNPRIPSYFYISGKTEFGKGLTTARIVSVSGNIVTDRNGEVYELGEASVAYMEWCRIHQYHIPTLETPIATK